MAIGDVSFVVECRSCKEEEWLEWEFCDLYDDALSCALKGQMEDGDECRIIRYTSLSEEDHGHHKTKIVAVFQPMPQYELQKQRSSNIKDRMLDRAYRIDSSDLQSDLLIAVRTIEELEAEIERLRDGGEE